ncbi:unnamed protein product, partial [Brassica rapa]
MGLLSYKPKLKFTRCITKKYLKRRRLTVAMSRGVQLEFNVHVSRKRSPITCEILKPVRGRH